MLIDITLNITPEIASFAQGNNKTAFTGHLGTHFDVMDKVFPLEYTERNAVVFDVSGVSGRDITMKDIKPYLVEKDMFVCFYTGFIENERYGSERYYTEHPQLSCVLIDFLLERGISIIAIDFAGVRHDPEHTPKDQYCADRGVFVVENVCNLKAVLGDEPHEFFTACTYPLSYSGLTGLPCRVIAKK